MHQPAEPRRIVADGYDRVADRYAALEAEDWPRNRHLEELLERLPDGAHVLDAGCGAGRPAAELIARRHRVTGVDISSVQIERARTSVPTGEFICGDITTVELPPSLYDAVVSFYAVDHIPRDEHAEVLRRFHAWLRPAGWLLLSAEHGDLPGGVGDWLGAPMYFSVRTAESMLQLLRDTGFEIIEHTVEEQHEAGKTVPYLWVLARR